MNEEEFIKFVGANIKKTRIEKGIKQIDLAIKIGIEDSSLRRIESGRTNPTLKTIFKIAEALEISLNVLWT